MTSSAVSQQLVELRAQVEHRATARGSAKGVASKKIKQLVRQLNEAGIEGDADTILATAASLGPQEQPKPKKKSKPAKFSREAILTAAETAQDAERLAEMTGYPLDASLRRRISWLVTKEHGLDERFLSVKERPSKKQQPEAVAA
jgi:predicted transcriptional regulator